MAAMGKYFAQRAADQQQQQRHSLELGRIIQDLAGQDSDPRLAAASARVPAAPEEEMAKNALEQPRQQEQDCRGGGENEVGAQRLALRLAGPTLLQRCAIAEAEQARPLAFRLASPTASSSSPALATPICVRGQVYPPPLATHEEVTRDPVLFMDTLCKFHEAMGSRMSSPRMGGNQLDLYRLYQEVTARGGLEQVIKDRLWKDIKAVFNFPRTTTSASFVLRKYYTSLLHHYEQVYFFRAEGSLVSPPAPLPAPSPGFLLPENGVRSDELELGPKMQKRRLQPAIDVDLEAHIGEIVTGSIEEKFEHGYLVTVVIGSDRFRGVLYHVPVGSSVPQYASTVATSRSTPEAANVGVRLRRRRKRIGMRRKDPNAPKLNRSGYNYFFAEQRAKLKLVYPDKDREISKMIGETWSSMTEEQKSPYQERGVKDKERYKREISDYRDRMKMQKLGISAEQQEQQEQQSGGSHEHERKYPSKPELGPACVMLPPEQQAPFQTASASTPTTTTATTATTIAS
ncbi:high mobility group B protein 9 isoform X2 [Selaginella moellendorffii]|uniref:high mobility group B protein 9 isoform X2 n=1 Tax=Selaginella moellendorffii TaxID=88036 RepID=UPI000D1C4B22|nr:high mobility group B protein 9 isoform X2 [Selaginella moellendorffii]|eukprot:XP_024527531.1 high mobility group B protein 9 isoform X2 [Selaginella moellendorffii]